MAKKKPKTEMVESVIQNFSKTVKGAIILSGNDKKFSARGNSCCHVRLESHHGDIIQIDLADLERLTHLARACNTFSREDF